MLLTESKVEPVEVNECPVSQSVSKNTKWQNVRVKLQLESKVEARIQ